MGEAIGQVLPLAVAVALSPIPIIAIVLILATANARINGPAFVVGCLAGLAIIGAIVLAIARPSGATDADGPATWVSVLKLILGVLCLLLALREWRGRPRGDDEPVTPGWLGSIDAFGPGKATGAGVLAGANPKNALLATAAAASIAASGLGRGEQAVAYAVFALIGTVGVATPVVVFFALGDRAAPVLDGLKRWMAWNNAVILAVLMLVIGAKLLGDAIGELGS